MPVQRVPEFLEVQEHQIGLLATLQRPDGIGEPHRSGTAQRGELEHRTCIHRFRSVPMLLHLGGEPHFVEDIQCIVAGCPIGTQRHANAPLKERRYVRNT